MKLICKLLSFIFISALTAPVFAQTHASVSLENQVYYALEQAQLRGLCSPLPGIKPYTQNIVISSIREILDSENSEKLNDTEREILEKYLDEFSKPKTGFELKRGGYYNETMIGKSEIPISANIEALVDIEASAGLYDSFKERYFGTEIWLGMLINGDLGNNVSYNFKFAGGLIQAPRKELGEYWTYYEGFPTEEETTTDFANRKIPVYGEPLNVFPYSYRKKWDGSVFFLSGLSSYNYWPDGIAGGYSLEADLTTSFIDDKLIVRLGRLPREWGSTSHGSSLFFNQAARPFYGFEASFSPVSWFSIASLTGALEYMNRESIKESARTFQNTFSINTLQFRYKNYLFFDFADAVVYPKRFEPGYMAPIISNFFYQNNVGDFDNMAMSFSLKGQYPGLGNIWISLFMDEMNFLSDVLTLDRQMFAWQAGTLFSLPILSFSSVKFSYTRISPYCYTHNRNFNPWYGGNRMETSYTNNGVSLGYYLPPNSDEFLIRFETMPIKNLNSHFQYQLIRHGADFGSSAVDGSNLQSELGGMLENVSRDSTPELKRFFLQDGAYQWLHIIKIGAEWVLEKAPIAFNFEVGTFISYFTNINGKANNGSAGDYSIIDTAEYPKSTGFIAKIGFRLFPK